ncbi:MAG: beta-propeller fold lactonase family protein [Candidatus Tectimicrobiota bacterium]
MLTRCFLALSLLLTVESTTSYAQVSPNAAPPSVPAEEPLPGMPPVVDPNDIYSETRPDKIHPAIRNFPLRVYVPNGLSDTVDVIDPLTYKVIESFPVDDEPQHVVPSYDLRTLWVLNNQGDSLTEIDPATGKKGRTVRVEDPYNLYYTPDGQYVVVVAERLKRLDFLDPQTMQVQHSLPVPCNGVNHLDYAAHGRYLIASCEFSNELIKVDVAARKVLGKIRLPHRRGQPQDVRLSPDGKVFYVADMRAHGVYLIDGDRLAVLGFLPTGKGAHGLNVSRDSQVLYVSNRGEGSITVVDFQTRKVVTKWRFPGGGSPDMGVLSADGKVLWLGGRYHHEVYAVDTTNGRLLARIKVGKGPHGVCLYPQPGRYSLGHTGNFR